MTQEEKQLLLKDLCARLPYGVKIKFNDGTDDVYNLDSDIHGRFIKSLIQAIDDLELKPYLRPMSSMTEEEKKEFAKIVVKSQDCSYQNNESATTMLNDWYLSKGFDVRGLIPKGLALEASEGMYKFNN